MEQLDYNDISDVKILLQENNLPVSDINEKITFFAQKENEKIIAVGGMESAGEDAIIRSIAVSDPFKGKGLGNKITSRLINYAREKGKKDIYLLTTTAENYFAKFRFKKIDRNQVPAAVQKSTQYTSVCPVSAVVMKLEFNQNI